MPSITLPLSEFQPDSLHRIEHEGSQFVVAHRNGRVFAFRDQCPHAFWPLSEGTLGNSYIECAGHGWQFDLETGSCLTTPVYCLDKISISLDADSVTLEWSDTPAPKAESGS